LKCNNLEIGQAKVQRLCSVQQEEGELLVHVITVFFEIKKNWEEEIIDWSTLRPGVVSQKEDPSGMPS